MSNLNAFDKEVKVIQLYYENAEANIVNSLFLETADTGADEESRVQKIKDKITETINDIIEKIKEFFAQIRRKIETTKIRHILSSEAARSTKKIAATVNDKETVKAIAAIYNIQNKAIIDSRKVYEQFMAHKIDFDTCRDKFEQIEEKAYDAIERVENDMDDLKLINTSSAKGNYMLSEITKRVNEVAKVQSKIIDKMEKEVIDEENRLRTEAARAAFEQAVAAAASRRAAFMSKINKKAVAAIIAVAGIAATSVILYNLANKVAYASRDRRVAEALAHQFDESAGEGDYFADILEDDYSTFEESVEDENFDYDSLWNHG